MKTDLFDYSLPADRIAQEPRPRGTSRLLVLDRRTGAVSHREFAELPSLLSPGDVLVRNDVAVRRARLWGRDAGGRLVEIFLLAPLDTERRRWTALAKPGRRAKPDRAITFPGGASARITEVHDDGRREAEFDRAIDDVYLESHGAVPLPPYIRRAPGATDRPEDRIGYQTVFAREPLAVAAPTAGLHFTARAFEEIRARGAAVADLTLAVGAGTFKPVTASEVERHAMDAEEVSIPAETLRAVETARSSGGRVVAVGTTVARSLEAAARLEAPASGSAMRFATNLFIAPGFEFRGIDALLTNFHLPCSTLLMLVSAFAGRERVLAAYEEAIREGYLFYSFGDAMFIA
ncbi:MAG TPA: tRNA preQ1(34) S-adenosylmethionine ribosyltransferase-isomerase QueA [Thermoanaerobaculia bacterium]|nr:tRNA preQ1(34) S-adenosylmethionine ribosyltransferase-isomerase QueA [Thermoanaerobaculia bacterium]